MPDIRYITLAEAAQLIQQAPDSDTKMDYVSPKSEVKYTYTNLICIRMFFHYC